MQFFSLAPVLMAVCLSLFLILSILAPISSPLVFWHVTAVVFSHPSGDFHKYYILQN